MYLQLINFPIFKKALGRLLVSNLSTSGAPGSQNFLTKNIRLLQTKWKGIICYQNEKPRCWPETMQSLKIIKMKTYTYTHTHTHQEHIPCLFLIQKKELVFQETAENFHRKRQNTMKTPTIFSPNLIARYFSLSVSEWAQTLWLFILDPILALKPNTIKISQLS